MESASKCPYDEHGLCVVATRLANVPVPKNSSSCLYCQAELVPMSANRVTAGLAVYQLVKLEKPRTPYLLQLASGRDKLAGHVLERYIHRWLRWLKINPPLNCGCEGWVAKMNAWGIQGSLYRLDEIVDQLYINLQKTYLAGIAIPLLTLPLLRKMVKRCLLKELS